MDRDDIEKNCKILYEILLQKESEIVDQIKSIKLSAISESAWHNSCHTIMDHIKEFLKEWDIYIPTFTYITSQENCIESFRYLLEIIQNENQLDFEKIEYINKLLKKPHITDENIYDCLERIPDLVEDLRKGIKDYNINPGKRMSVYKSLKRFATDIYSILNKLFMELGKFPDIKSEDFHISIIDYIGKLLNLSFVISEYPPTIIKKGTTNQSGTNFHATISCLIKQDNLFSSMLNSQIYFLNETDLQNYVQLKTINANSRISFKDVRKTQNNWSFKNMIWHPSSRHSGDKFKLERITNIKSIILFKIKITANPYAFNNSFEIHTELYSDTVISVVHTSQEIEARLTLFWDYYFRIDKTLFLRDGTFACKESVTNTELITAISDHFHKHTTRGLTLSNQEFLERKLFTHSENGLVTFQSLVRTKMLDSKYSFGQWIFSIINLLKVEGTIGMWKHDLIDGFVPKDSSVYFMNASNGTFYLRFSERNPTIGVVVKIGSKNDAWSPFDIVECRSRSLPERLMDYDELRFVRNANGIILNKIEILEQFIIDKKPDEGYIARGRQRLSTFLDRNIYTDMINIPNFDDVDIKDDSFFPGSSH